MHGIDRTLAEFEPEMDTYETGQEEYEFQDEYEFEGPDTRAINLIYHEFRRADDGLRARQ